MEKTDNVRIDASAQGGNLVLADKPKPDYQLSNEELLELSPKQDLFIDYMAFAAFTLDGAGRLDQMTSEQIATKLGVTDRTLRRWRRSIPGYAELVRKRRMEKFRIEIEDGVWKGLIAKALIGEPKQAEMVLSHFSDYTPPAQKVEHKVEGLADLVQLARAAKRVRGVVTDAPDDDAQATTALIEGEVVQRPQFETPSPQTAPERPETAHTVEATRITPPVIPQTAPKVEQPAPTMRVIQPPDDPDPEFDDMP